MDMENREVVAGGRVVEGEDEMGKGDYEVQMAKCEMNRPLGCVL